MGLGSPVWFLRGLWRRGIKLQRHQGPTAGGVCDIAQSRSLLWRIARLENVDPPRSRHGAKSEDTRSISLPGVSSSRSRTFVGRYVRLAPSSPCCSKVQNECLPGIHFRWACRALEAHANPNGCARGDEGGGGGRCRGPLGCRPRRRRSVRQRRRSCATIAHGIAAVRGR